MSENQRAEDGNEFSVNEKQDGINDGEVDGHDNIIDDKTTIEEHDVDHDKVVNIEENQQEPSRNSDNNNDEVDVDIDDDDVHDYTKDFIGNEYNDCDVQLAIRREESIDTIMEILKLFPMQVRHKNKLGYYPLHTACHYGHENAAWKLIELYPQAAQYRTSNYLLMYPLQLAIWCRDGVSARVEMKLIEIFPKAVMESTTRDKSVLHLACNSKMQCETLITKLIQMNPLLIQEKYSEGDYPIHRAIIRNQSIKVIKLLLNGDPLGMQRITVARGINGDETSLHLACFKRNHDLVEYFMQRSDLRINVRDKYFRRTPLHNACIYATDKIVEMILNCPNVDVNVTDCYNDTPLHTLRYNILRYNNDNSEIFVSIVQKLLDHPNIFIDYKNNNNKTPLDLFKEHRDSLLEKKSTNDHQLRCLMQIIHLLEEFTVKKRWKAYCYHFKNTTE